MKYTIFFRFISRTIIGLLISIPLLCSQAVDTNAAVFAKLVKDIGPGTGSSLTRDVEDHINTIFFVASVFDLATFTTDTRLWVHDPFGGSTVRLPGNGLIARNPGEIVGLTNIPNTLVFFAADTSRVNLATPGGFDFLGNELWFSDGTNSGTVLVKDLSPQSLSSSPRNLISSRGDLYFSASVRTLPFGNSPTGRELYRYRPDTGQITLLKDINPGSGSSFGRIAKPVAAGTGLFQKIFFWADDGTHGFELWVYDESTGAAHLTRDINPGAASSAPVNLNPARLLGSRKHQWFNPVVYSFNHEVYFAADDGVHGIELWKSDGTVAGTQLVADINPAPGMGSKPQWLTEANGTLYFDADDGTRGRELWKSNGFTTGTQIVTDMVPGAGSFRNSTIFPADNQMTAFKGLLYFSASHPTLGTGLWRSDGTAVGTLLVKSPGAGEIFKLTACDNGLYFAADDGVHGVELWASDGTGPNTFGSDINAGSGSAITLIQGPRPIDFKCEPVTGSLYFPAATAALGDELWQIVDSVSAGAVAVPIGPPGYDLHFPVHGNTGTDLSVKIIDIDNPVPVTRWSMFLPQIDYDIVVTNHGPKPASNVRVAMTAPLDTTSLGLPVRVATFPGFGCVNPLPIPGAPDVECNIDALGVGQQKVFFVGADVPLNKNTATASADVSFGGLFAGLDFNLVNNHSVETTQIINPPLPPIPAEADLAIVHISTLNPVRPGGQVSYEIGVRNKGPAAATGVVATDALPAGLVFVSATTSLGICTEAAGTVTCNIGAMNGGQSASINIIGRAPAASGAISNTVTVTAPVTDPDLTNNSGTALTLVGFGPNPLFLPPISLSLNSAAFNSTTNKTMTLTATTVASVPPTNADIYVALQLPDGTLLVMQPDGSFSTTLTPLLSNVPVPDFTGPIFNFTFTGAEPVGNYTWFAALTTPGTLSIIGTLATAPFSFGP